MHHGILHCVYSAASVSAEIEVLVLVGAFDYSEELQTHKSQGLVRLAEAKLFYTESKDSKTVLPCL